MSTAPKMVLKKVKRVSKKLWKELRKERRPFIGVFPKIYEGRRYYLATNYRKKLDAKKRAEKIRRNGMYARVIPRTGIHGKVWSVYKSEYSRKTYRKRRKKRK